MDKFLARFKPYNKKGRKDNTSSTSAVGGTSGSSQSARRDKTSSSTAVSGSLADNQNVGSSQSKSAAPRIDLDFKIPGERTVLDPPAQVIAEHEQGESRSARILSSLEKKAVSKRRFTAGEALVAWQVSGNDLKAIGLKKADVFKTPSENQESLLNDFYRLTSVFTVSMNPSLLHDYPSLSDYFPPPAFVPETHDWRSDYTSYSGYVRDPLVLAHMLRWITKRVSAPPSGTRDERGLPEWYRAYVERERVLGFPPNAYKSVLEGLIPSEFNRYLEVLFDQMAVICANETDNGASVDWMCGILGWWIMGMKMDKENPSVDKAIVLKERWSAASGAFGHLFRSWIRAHTASDNRLPLLVRNLVDAYKGSQYETVASRTETVLWMDVLNEVEHDSLQTKVLTQDELGIGLIREAKYGSSKSLDEWLNEDRNLLATPGASKMNLFDLLSQSTTTEGEYLTDFDPAVVPLPLSPGSPFESQTVYRPFRKTSTSSFFPDFNTPNGPSRANSSQLLPSHTRGRSESGSMLLNESGQGNPLSNLTASSTVPAEDWKSFARSGFGDASDKIGLKLGAAFDENEKKPSAHREYQTLRAESARPFPTSSPSASGSPNKIRRQRKRDVAGVFSITGMTAQAVDSAFLDFLKDSEMDQDESLRLDWPTFLILRIDREKGLDRLKGECIVVNGKRKRLDPPVIASPPPAASPSDLMVQNKEPATTAGTTTQRKKTNRRASLFNILSIGPSKPKMSASPSYTSSLDAEAQSEGVSAATVGELGQLTSNDNKPLLSPPIQDAAQSRPRSASGSQSLLRKQVPGLLDNVKVDPTLSLNPSAEETTKSEAATSVESPIAITGSDSKGNLVQLQQDTGLVTPAERENIEGDYRSSSRPHTPTSMLSPDDSSVVGSSLLTPRRNRRSAAPSPASSIADQDMHVSAEQNDLEMGVSHMDLSTDVAGSVAVQQRDIAISTSTLQPAAMIELGAPITIAGGDKGFRDVRIVASSVLEEEEAASSSQRTPPTFLRSLVAGAVAGLSVDLMFYPIDTIKTRLQSQQGFVKAGGFKGIYKGVGSVGVGSAPGAAAFFTAYENLKHNLPKHSSTFNQNPALTHMFAASGGEFMACLIRVPTEIVKSRTQTSAYGASSSSLSSAMSVFKYEGFKGFYRGFGITLAREIPFTAIQFPLYEALKTELSENYLSGKRKPLAHEAAGCGMIAGGIAAALTTPLDVVKTRAMLEAKATTNDGASRRAASVLSIPNRLAQITSQEGVKALFAGVVPRTMWISLGGAVFLGAYDLVSDPFQMKM